MGFRITCITREYERRTAFLCNAKTLILVRGLKDYHVY